MCANYVSVYSKPSQNPPESSHIFHQLRWEHSSRKVVHLRVCMYVCVYVCVCVYECVNVCAYHISSVTMGAFISESCSPADMYVCMYVCMHACMHVCMYLSCSSWKVVRLQISIFYVCMYLLMYVCVPCICIYKHRNTHTHANKHAFHR